MFVAYNDVWYTEYKVAYEGLRALGYDVDVVSSNTGEALTYGGAVSGSVEVGFSEFQDLFEANFGIPWDSSWTAQANIPLDGRIQDITNLDEYDALVMPGGRGTVAYEYDGSYANLSPQDAPGTHITTVAEVQAAAEKLNELINIALQEGKPVGAQCHGAPLIGFARINGTAGSGFDNLGTSVLSGKYATGYPLNDGTVAADYANLGINYLNSEKLVVDGPDAPNYNGNGRDLLVTTLDWRAETVAYFVQTVHNMLTSYPAPTQRTQPLNVLVFGGDEPTNYGTPPVRHTDLAAMLNDASDELNITAVATSNTADMTLANLQNYDVLVYNRHNNVSQAIEDAVVDFVDGGGGLVGLHHAIYNQGGNNGTLINLFGGELSGSASLDNEMWIVYNGESNRMINVNMGHFVSTYGVYLTPGQPTSTIDYTTPLGIPNANLDGNTGRGYYHFTIEAPDELYVGSVFNDGVVFGTGVNEINRLFSNDRFVESSLNPNNGHYDTWGWTREYDTDGGEVGRIVYLEPGETVARTLAHPSYQQVIKNAVVWTALADGTIPNQAPTAVSDSYTMEQNSTLTVSAPGVLGNDSDPEADPLTVTTHDAASNGSLTINSDGSLTYTPTTDFVGQETINYTISDSDLTDSATLTIDVWETLYPVYLPLVIRP